MSTAAMSRCAKRRSRSRIEVSSSATGSTKSAKSATGELSTRIAISRGSPGRSPSFASHGRSAKPRCGEFLREVAARNRVRDGLVYLQITRGVARRDFAFPTNELRPTLVVTAKGANAAINAAHAAAGVKVITVPETRWAHPHIKSLQLLPSVLAKQAARETGAFEAWFVDAQGFVTEGASSNAWIVGADRSLVTRQADAAILRGVTRTTLLDVARRLGLRFEERPFARDEAYAAREAFNSSATTIAMPVVEIDGRAIGDGKPGPVVKALRAAFHSLAQSS